MGNVKKDACISIAAMGKERRRQQWDWRYVRQDTG